MWKPKLVIPPTFLVNKQFWSSKSPIELSAALSRVYRNQSTTQRAREKFLSHVVLEIYLTS